MSSLFDLLALLGSRTVARMKELWPSVLGYDE
jgi:hypothetical protein